MTTGEDVTDDLDRVVAAFSRDQLARNGVPDDALAADRVRCRDVVAEVLAGRTAAGDVLCSPLGPAWTEMFQVVVTGPVPEHVTAREGWLPLDRLLPSPPSGSPVLGTWAVVEEGRVLGGVRVVRQGGQPDAVAQVLDRCADRGRVRLCDVLELRQLRRDGCAMPPSSPVLAAAADVESGLGGRLLAPWATGRAAHAPVRLRRVRPGGRFRLVVAVSGVDGSGKTTLRAGVEDALRRAGVPVSTVWVRPGMGLGPLVRLASWVKRRLGEPPTPGIRAMSEAGAGADALRSRRGAVGWAWAMLVSLSFVAGVWRQHREAEGVVLYDRHLVDALATLDFAYEGVDLRLQRALVRRLLPRADVSFYLDVPAEVSVTRKPDDVIGAAAVARQLTAYDQWLRALPASCRLDATLPAGELVGAALGVLTSESDGATP